MKEFFLNGIRACIVYLAVQSTLGKLIAFTIVPIALLEFCLEKELCVSNTWFIKVERRKVIF